MEAYTYLLVNLACIFIPFIASFYPKHTFYKEWKSFFKANILVTLLFVIWDSLFTKIGVWGFNETYLTGIHIGNLPLEEILFFICIPYACVFSYFAFQYFFKTNFLQKSQAIISYILIAILFVVAVFNYNKLYTSVTFFGTCYYLMYLIYKKTDLSLHYLSYLFVLPFFFLSNGVLTGSFLVEPIVWYNDAENLGIRLFNIPIEDSIYGLLLIFMNIELYCYFKRKA
ncbi:lycopene cyclase domain-containing protein [Xanthomarina spongicola]|uniref:Lycopene cyclase domain-containing protein n=1 Tax=Xanthomarina spongicola TaxID=570520 RepID=A0A316DWI1_9FLAO|nr:lycopene cyclase domain-containing protein [Xanthomarina spongicola]PWK20943.1 lycopene cyclase domain-containing protein [Xanthomarina spongicola]